jgi:hypothetical protein
VGRDRQHDLDVIVIDVGRAAVGPQRQALDELVRDEAEVAQLGADAVCGGLGPGPEHAPQRVGEQRRQRHRTEEDQQRAGTELLDGLGQQLDRGEHRHRRDREAAQDPEPRGTTARRRREPAAQQHRAQGDEEGLAHSAPADVDRC